MEKLILLVDDDTEEHEIMSEALRAGSIPASCLWANGAEHALRILIQLVPDFIFIDLNMPAVNGLSFLKSIRGREDLEQVPKVIYSTHINPVVEALARQYGAVCCLEKPTNLPQLVTSLNHFMAVYTTT